MSEKLTEGDVAQMVERSLSMWEVGGSIPPVSNKSFEDNFDQLLLDFFLVLYRKAIYAPALSTILFFFAKQKLATKTCTHLINSGFVYLESLIDVDILGLVFWSSKAEGLCSK